MTSFIVKPANKSELFLLQELFNKMQIEYKPITNNDDEFDESEEWYRFSMNNLSRAYSNDEPEYTSDMIKEPNPNYKPYFENKK